MRILISISLCFLFVLGLSAQEKKQADQQSIEVKKLQASNDEITAEFQRLEESKITAITLEFYSKGKLQYSSPITNFDQKQWTLEMSSYNTGGLGLQGGMWCDIVPVYTFENGTSSKGREYLDGADNDVFILPEGGVVPGFEAPTARAVKRKTKSTAQLYEVATVESVEAEINDLKTALKSSRSEVNTSQLESDLKAAQATLLKLTQ